MLSADPALSSLHVYHRKEGTAAAATDTWHITEALPQTSCTARSTAEAVPQLQAELSARALAVIKEQSLQSLNFSSSERAGNIQK